MYKKLGKQELSVAIKCSSIQTEDILSPDCVEAAIVRNMDKHLDKMGFWNCSCDALFF